MRKSEIWIVYDGDCPFCSAYTRMVRLRDSVGQLHLVNAREGHPILEEIAAADLDLNEGMVLKMGGQLYHGDECIHRVALLSTRSTFFNRLNEWLFRRRWLARVLYPVLRAGRNATLAILGFDGLQTLPKSQEIPAHKHDQKPRAEAAPGKTQDSRLE